MKRETPLRRTAPLRARRTTTKRRAISPASPAQRAKCSLMACAVCGTWDTDPAHIASRAQGGCNDEACVIPCCRQCHRLFDDGKLDLLPHLEPKYRRELGHALEHLGLMGLMRRVTNSRTTKEAA